MSQSVAAQQGTCRAAVGVEGVHAALAKLRWRLSLQPPHLLSGLSASGHDLIGTNRLVLALNEALHMTSCRLRHSWCH